MYFYYSLNWKTKEQEITRSRASTSDSSNLKKNNATYELDFFFLQLEMPELLNVHFWV